MIYVVRHGQTDWNVEGRIAGQTDIPLNEVGIRQAEELREKLKDIEFAYVFSSPLQRAYQTAKIITDKDIAIDKRLIERSNGKLEGLYKKDIDNLPDFNKPGCTDYGVEPVESIQERIGDFIEEICQKYSGKDILVVTHAGVGINLRCYMEGPPEDEDYSKYKLANCEVLKYEN